MHVTSCSLLGKNLTSSSVTERQAGVKKHRERNNSFSYQMGLKLPRCVCGCGCGWGRGYTSGTPSWRPSSNSSSGRSPNVPRPPRPSQRLATHLSQAGPRPLARCFPESARLPKPLNSTSGTGLCPCSPPGPGALGQDHVVNIGVATAKEAQAPLPGLPDLPPRAPRGSLAPRGSPPPSPPSPSLAPCDLGFAHPRGPRRWPGPALWPPRAWEHQEGATASGSAGAWGAGLLGLGWPMGALRSGSEVTGPVGGHFLPRRSVASCLNLR